MTPEQVGTVIDQIIEMATLYSMETRIRRLMNEHYEAGASPRTLVMNMVTWRRLVQELDGRGYRDGLFWTPQAEGSLLDPVENTHAYMGVPILIKDFLPDMEIIIGV